MIGDLTQTQMEHLLQNSVVCHLGCHDRGRTYVVPMAFAYDNGCLYAHSGLGLKVEMMRASRSVCVETTQIDSLANWKSVIISGEYEELEGSERDAGLRILIDHLEPHIAGEPEPPHGEDGPDVGSTRHFLDRSSRHGVVFRVRIREMTGRFEKR